MSIPFLGDVGAVGCKFTHTTANATTAVKVGAGILASITVNTGAVGTATVYNSLSASGAVVAVIDTSVVGTKVFNVAMTIGITVVTSASPDITVTYR